MDDAAVFKRAQQILVERARQPKQLACQVCTRPFVGAGRAKYCSPYCRVKAYRQKHRGEKHGNA